MNDKNLIGFDTQNSKSIKIIKLIMNIARKSLRILRTRTYQHRYLRAAIPSSITPFHSPPTLTQSPSSPRFHSTSTGGGSDTTPPPPSKPNVVEVTKETFQEIIQGSATTPTIIDCYADWCQPCQQLTPMLEQCIEATKGNIILAKINTDEQPELAKALNVSSLPTVYGIFDGQAVDQFVGIPPPEQLKAFMEKMEELALQGAAKGGEGTGQPGQPGQPAGGGTAEDDIARAGAMLHDQNDHVTAAGLYQAVLQREDVELKSLNAAVAMAGVLQCAIRSENKEAIAALIEHITDAKGPHAEHVENKETHLYTVIAEGRMLLSLDEKLQQSDGSSLDELLKKVELEPKNVEAWYSLAVQHLTKGEHEESMNAALKVVRLDKTWNDAAGKKLLFEMFEMLGNDNDLVQAARRRLTNLIL